MNGRSARHTGYVTLVVLATLGGGCSSSNHGAPVLDAAPPATDATVDATTNPAGDGGEDATPEPSDGGEDSSADAAPAPTCITPTTPQSCTPPEMTTLAICKLSQTGCMDATDVTHFAAQATYYEVNSPFWSDDAAKTRAFVIPDGGTIHVKDCLADASADAQAECVSPSNVPSGPADTGKWVFPVGTVMIKNFLLDGKLVETRLLMRVDAPTAALLGNGTDWVGYTYAWNEAQTEATLAPPGRTEVMFNTGQRTVAWNYPNVNDCITCHNPAVGTLGPETDQMNRIVDGGNQIDVLKARGLFDTTAPTEPYAAALVEPYASAALGLTGPPAGATTDQEARSYLSSNCSFCHRPDVISVGFDLRYSLSLAQTGICGRTQENGIPGMTNQTFLDLAPGNHAASAMWIRMNTPVPASDTNEAASVGRMPPLASYVVDSLGTALIGTWIDAITSCPDAGP